MTKRDPARLRSRQWFDDPKDPGMTALYLERYLNFGLTREELQSGRPIIAIAQSGSDLSPCNRHHIDLAQRVREGIRDAGGIPLEFPVHPIQETGRRPTAALDRNLATLGLIEILHGYPIDGVVLTTGCDKTTPSQIMAAATVDIPAIVLSGGPMLNGRYHGRCVGSGTVIWEARQQLAEGIIDTDAFMDMAASSAPSIGHCNTMGTALSMNCLAEGLGMSLPGCASIPAPYRERGQISYLTGKRIVEMVWEDLRPSQILTAEAFHNAITLCSAIGGSTNAPVHINAIARHAGVDISMNTWQDVGQKIPLIVNCQPTGEYLSEEFHHAGGVPAVMAELLKAGFAKPAARTVNGRTAGENYADSFTEDRRVIRACAAPLIENAGLMVLSGNLFDSAVMKISAVGDDFRARYLSDPDDPNAFEGVAVVFDGPEDYHARINDPDLAVDARSILVIRGCGTVGYPGSAEVVNMLPPDRLVKAGLTELPTIGDGRQSGTSYAPSILNASPEAAAGGGLAKLRTGDRIRIDLNTRRADALVAPEIWDKREPNVFVPPSQTPWQAVYRDSVGQLDDGGVMTTKFGFATVGPRPPRHSH
ncbi:IlvD/Edd family dehydratase [Varunaivibrio sulfuroxidans]|uniref:Dihydroxy-acid dehydratase n=1 Tax=Varunaivibrio sulfuroxidans TaxID=1773489 RepID=A0A4R3J6I3_9PROT|nr:IlvD/Edd family dehydratase [Varunaivibrio sulfuroxidans]TCS60944.1 dihydroxy-acid dehydratase [Varunaivibrio sulfuroxidans]WES31648.1 dihydroxy-acid dehydratase family protein [Varunaivibrio sulfuroxidans]